MECLETHYSKFALMKKMRKCSSHISSLKIEAGVFSCPDAVLAILSLIILGISDTSAASFDAVLCMFSESSTEANSISLLVPFILSFLFHQKYFFHDTLGFSLNFNNNSIRKFKHSLT